MKAAILIPSVGLALLLVIGSLALAHPVSRIVVTAVLPGETVDYYTGEMRIHPQDARFYRFRAAAFASRSEYRRAIEDYELAIRLDPQDAVSRAALAWIYAACPIDAYRNGNTAVIYARTACEMTRFGEPIFIAALGAAYAEVGNYCEAVRWESMSLEHPHYSRHDAEQGRLRLQLYERHKAYRRR